MLCFPGGNGRFIVTTLGRHGRQAIVALHPVHRIVAHHFGDEFRHHPLYARMQGIPPVEAVLLQEMVVHISACPVRILLEPDRVGILVGVGESVLEPGIDLQAGRMGLVDHGLQRIEATIGRILPEADVFLSDGAGIHRLTRIPYDHADRIHAVSDTLVDHALNVRFRPQRLAGNVRDPNTPDGLRLRQGCHRRMQQCGA